MATVGGWFAQAAIQTLVDRLVRLSSSAIPAYKSQSGLGDALDSLNISLLEVDALLNGRPKRRGEEDIKSLNELLKLLKEAAYDAEDLIGELEYENLKLKMEREGDRSSSSLGDTLLEFARGFLDDKTTEVEKVQEKLNNITAGLTRVLQVLPNVSGRQQVENDRMRRETTSFLTEPVVGRDMEKDKLIKLLLNTEEASQSNNTSMYHVISVVGIGGVGKSTLAQSVYNDDSRLRGYFQEKLWICASDPFDVEKLTKDLVWNSDMKQPEPANLQLANLDRLQKMVKEKLKSKKFLLVIDDVWNKNKSEWERFCAPLRSGAPGSKILVTCRSLEVAKTIGTKDEDRIDLKGLEDEPYWQFFKKCAFGYEDSKKYTKLEAIGKKIAIRLKGIPLAAKTLGSLLNQELNEEHWKTIMASKIWDLNQNENDILPVLKLSYDYLPPCLKQCFAYCSLFPKDFEFEKDTLVQMWMAQGFITSQRKLLMEDVGRGYVKDLLSRGLFEQVANDDGKMMMHDLLHDLAQSISKDECYRIDDSNKPQMIPALVYHLSVCDPNLEPRMITGICNQHKKLRTLLFVCGTTRNLSVEELDQLLSGLTCMRVFVLKQHSGTDELPDGIGDLKQLRYLDVSRTNVRKLPESLCRLYNLQVLKLDPEYEVSFPKGVTNLISLRHLSANQGSVIMIANIGKLTSLQNLRLFSIRKKHGYMIEELKDMDELRGHLIIENLENIDSKEEASRAKLDNKKYLKELQLEWAYERHTDLGIEISDAVILEGLRPHSNLEELKIVNYGGLQCPSWLESQFVSNLVSIRLINCKHMVRLPPLGQLPYLKVLELEGLNAVKEVGGELYGTRQSKAFPLLKTLEKWPLGYSSQMFPCLEEITIMNCPKMKVLVFEGLNAVKEVGEELSGTRQSKAFPLLKKLYFNDMPELEKWTLGYCSQMPPCLEEITIMNCPKMKVLPMLPPKVERLEIIEVGVDAFPSFGHLSCLKTLHYGGLVGVRKVEDLFGGTEFTGFPSLEELKFEYMPELEEWSGAYGSHLFPCLKKVSIRWCPKLRNLPFCLPPSLVKLKLEEVGLDALPGIWVSQESSSSSGYHQSASLTEVDIRNCPNLKSLEEWLLPNQLTALRRMSIEDCGELTSLPIERFKDLSGLERLTLRNCPKLTYAVEAAGEEEQNNDLVLLFPSSLKGVELGCCGDLDRALLLCLRGATSLERLGMADFEHITSFPGEYEYHMTKLEHLTLKGLTELKTLDSSLRCFTYLRKLTIRGCLQLKAIPEDSLPSSLESLGISNCHPDLKERCQKDTGDDWPKIAHIRFIYIDGKSINS